MAQLILSRAMNMFLFILLYKPKSLRYLVHLISAYLYPGAPDVKGHPCEIHETLDDNLAIVPNLGSPISPSRYKPLRLPPILHDFPVKY